ncbi:ABC transporter substrate-binding protein [Cryobacterium psychrophilum]|uniref:ABC transporter substrate-binding protein n=1 Tax=Cryobacterium psychrophilum TaxID=41988 RepID=A0A4Y8KS22_9MICO|nr:ABC transporter substrate-binding protein [Cryobacterium psychrophilum]TDW28731.1 putative spermidine/putrescine transport system substrate-binding protein [Cryobacterium psychrophilum]TFD82388.1 ABC transporter substrate-binding protein [Cryobacterium psychrophilum]
MKRAPSWFRRPAPRGVLGARATRAGRLVAVGTALALTLGACAAPAPDGARSSFTSWDDVVSAAQGQTVKLWMYGGDAQGNAYVDDVLAPAVAAQGVTLQRVPIADTKDALNRVLSELQAGRTQDGTVDLVWLNGNNFRTGKEAGAWLCDWTTLMPNLALTAPDDPLLTHDFGTPVEGCEAPWSKAQFTFVYNSGVIADPPTTLDGILAWAEAHPGRFTYPAPPDFTGSVFTREVLYSVSGGYDNVPAAFDQSSFDTLTPALFTRLTELAPSLWRDGSTYPANEKELNQLYADRQIDMTMTYGPATLTTLVNDGTYPPGTTVLTREEGTVGNASFLGLPANAGSTAGAMVVANVALSAEQQLAKADPRTWGQFTVLDRGLLAATDRAAFDALPFSPVVPSYDVLSKNANPELAAAWVPALDDGWRTSVLSGR